MKKLIAILILTIATLNAWGAKAYPFPLTITQKDGKQLTYQLHGDEHFNYATTTDGVLLCQEGNDFYIAVIKDNGEMAPSNVLAHNAGQRTPLEIALIGKQDIEKFFKTSKRTAKRAPLVMPNYSFSQTLFPHIGSPKALVVLADFQDQKFKRYVESDKKNDSITVEIFNQYLNASGKPQHEMDATLKLNYGSVRKYFSDMSGGDYTPIFEVLDSVVHLSDSMKVYGPGKDDDMPRLFEEVCDSIDRYVDFSQYDANDDGKVDLIYIIYAGYGQNMGGATETIWAKSGTVSVTHLAYVEENGVLKEKEVTKLYDNKAICRYGVHSELCFDAEKTRSVFGNVPQINGIGVFCHEFSHCLGLPDLYPTTEDAQTAGNPAMEFWDLMDGGEYSGTNGSQPGGYSPTAYTAWEREYMGWMEMEVLKEADNLGERIELIPIDASRGKAYKIFPNDDDTGKEYVFIQNIQPYLWNKWLGQYIGKGMLVTYVAYDQNAFRLGSGPNNVIGYPRMTIVPADSLLISYYQQGDKKKYTSSEYIQSHRGDPFPGTSERHELLSIYMYWGKKTMEKPLLNIQENNGVVSFYYLLGPQITTDIQQSDLDSTTKETKIYTLDGRYVGKSTRGLAKGVYIINGKKTVIR